MLDERDLAELRRRLAVHATGVEQRRQIDAIVMGVHLAGTDAFGPLRTMLVELQRSEDYHAAVQLIVKTCYGHGDPNPDLVVGIGTSPGRSAAPMEVLAAEVFVAIAGGDAEAARTMLHDDDPHHRTYRQCMVLGLLLRWLHAQADAGFPPYGPSEDDGRAASLLIGPVGEEDIAAVCELCGHSRAMHDILQGDCPPPSSRNPCCGASMDDEIQRPCAWGNCVELFCVCGVFTGGGWGPAGCPCGDNYAGWNRPHPDQRPKYPVPGGARNYRRYRARRG